MGEEVFYASRPSTTADGIQTITDVILSQTTQYVSVDPGFHWNTEKFIDPAKSPYLSGQSTRHG
jgi:hypothetical protein